jgi:NADH-quinone oxidoreductase subunit H
MSGFFATVFLGGYRFFGLETLVIGDGWAIGNLLGLIIFFVKMFFVYFIYIWIRGTLPRVRVDQILNFNWKLLVPVSLALVLLTALTEQFLPPNTGEYTRAGVHLTVNVLLAFITIEIMRAYGRRQRRLVSGGGNNAAAVTDSHGHGAHDDHGHDAHSHGAHSHEPVAAH